LHEAYGDKVQFFLVYIAEAHALDGQRPKQGPGDPLVEEPITLEERIALAGECVKDLELGKIPTLVDLIDDKVSRDYSAWPDRLLLVGLDGKVAYSGGPGPQGFKPEELKAAIETLLSPKKVEDSSAPEQAGK
jgi:hypothetical protein